MTAHATDFRRCLVDLDIAGMRSLWLSLYPHLHQPVTDEQVLVTLHMARTRANSLTARQRIYSHHWLVERDYPSGLPDRLKPQTEPRPTIVSAVGVSVNFTISELKPAGQLIEKVMADTVAQLYADGEQRPETVRTLMLEAGAKERKKLFGPG